MSTEIDFHPNITAVDPNNLCAVLAAVGDFVNKYSCWVSIKPFTTSLALIDHVFFTGSHFQVSTHLEF